MRDGMVGADIPRDLLREIPENRQDGKTDDIGLEFLDLLSNLVLAESENLIPLLEEPEGLLDNFASGVGRYLSR